MPPMTMSGTSTSKACDRVHHLHVRTKPPEAAFAYAAVHVGTACLVGRSGVKNRMLTLLRSAWVPQATAATDLADDDPALPVRPHWRLMAGPTRRQIRD